MSTRACTHVCTQICTHACTHVHTPPGTNGDIVHSTNPMPHVSVHIYYRCLQMVSPYYYPNQFWLEFSMYFHVIPFFFYLGLLLLNFAKAPQWRHTHSHDYTKPRRPPSRTTGPRRLATLPHRPNIRSFVGPLLPKHPIAFVHGYTLTCCVFATKVCALFRKCLWAFWCGRCFWWRPFLWPNPPITRSKRV